MRGDRVKLMRSCIALAAVIGGLSLLGSPGPAYAAEERADCSAYATNTGGSPQKADTKTAPVPDGVAPFAIMRIPEAQQVSKQGQGIRVAVVDSGYSRSAKAYYGTVAAGLISQIAPKAKLSDHPVLKVGQEKSTVDAKQMTAELNSLAKGNAKGLIVDIGLPATQAAPGLDAAVDTLTKKGAIVVMAADWSGVTTDTDPLDIAPKVFPNADDPVVTVSASGTWASDPNFTVLPNSNTDVVAPTYGAASTTLFGQPCWVDSITTSFASAEVAGVLALIWSTNSGWSAQQVIDRLYSTTSGREGQGGRYWGAGVVNAYAALTRPAVKEAAAPPEIEQAPMAREKADPLAAVRENAIWWGIAGGGALGLGLVLRPLFSRRKSSM
ncbi:S8/S53 family peptidase [Nocardioides sp. NPDC004968]|uniref:S8/S53 family peptidase n=1 Tax=Nocardioides sp. NPDC004968 TaxID=3155894 RepID=UPI0033A88C43